MYNDVIAKLDHYMFDVKLLTRMSIHNIVANPKTDTTQKEVSEWETRQRDQLTGHSKERFMFLKEQDQLFWCYYAIINGFSVYEVTNTHQFLTEKNEKLKCIDLLRLHRKQLTANKIRGLSEDIEDNLVNSKKISVKTFVALCIVSNLNIIFIHRRKYYELCCNPDDADTVHVVHQFDSPNTRYAYENDITPSRVADYRTKYFKARSLENPLRAISSYKIGELREICVQLNITEMASNQKTKQQLYSLIVENI